LLMMTPVTAVGIGDMVVWGCGAGVGAPGYGVFIGFGASVVWKTYISKVSDIVLKIFLMIKKL